MTSNPSLSNGRYEVYRCIGKGGMAAVFLARDNVLQIERAIKVLKPEYMVRANVRQRFATEAVAMARLSHPNVVQIFDHGQQGMTSFIVMEFLPYGSLQGYLDSIGLMERDQALTICRDVAQALKLAHDSGIIHRDIKPDNILMHPNGAKLTDFGLARISETSVRQTQTQVVMGTFPYMAPEQRLSAKKTTHQADIYALGATLYAMLSHEDPTELYDQTAHQHMFANLPEDIAQLIATACHTDLEQRYQTADELIAAIDQRLSDTDASFQLSKKDFSSPVNLEELHRDWQHYTGNGDDDTEPNTQDNPTDTMFFEGLMGAGLAFTDVNDDTRVKGLNFPEELIPKNPSPERVLNRQTSLTVALVFITALLGTIIYLTLAQTDQEKLAKLKPETPATILALSTPTSDTDQQTMNRAITATLDGNFHVAQSLVDSKLKQSYPNEVSVHILDGLLGLLQNRQAVAAQAVLKSEQLATGRAEPIAAAAQLVAKSLREPEQVPAQMEQWQDLRSTHDDPMLDLLYVMSTQKLPDNGANIRQLRSANRNQAAFAYAEYLSTLQQGDEASAMKLIKTAAADFPDTELFVIERAEQLLAKGKIEIAEELMVQLLERQKSTSSEFTQGQPFSLLGGIYIRMNTDAYPTPETEEPELGRMHTTYLMLLTGETVSNPEKLSGMLHFGDHFANTGQLKEASKVWDFCFRMAETDPAPEEKLFVPARMCGLQALNTLLQLDAGSLQGSRLQLFDYWTSLQQNSLQTNTVPEIDQYFRAHLEHVRGISAAREGDLNTAKAKLQSIKSRPSSALLPTSPFAESLELELMLAERDGAEQSALLLNNLHTETGDTCGLALKRAKVAEQLSQPTEVKQQLSNILEGKCIIEISEHGVVLAEAQVWQAERLWKSDNAAARQLLTSFQQHWSEADPNLRLKLRADALSKK